MYVQAGAPLQEPTVAPGASAAILGKVFPFTLELKL